MNPLDTPLFGTRIPLLQMPRYRQSTEYTCGAAALKVVLEYYGIPCPDEMELARELGTTSAWGTDPSDIIRVATKYGLHAELCENLSIEDLRGFVAEGVPFIASFQAWRAAGDETLWKEDWKDGHYAVVVGVSASEVLFEDPSLDGENALGVIEHGEFLERWHDMTRTDEVLSRAGIVIRNLNAPARKATEQLVPSERLQPVE